MTARETYDKFRKMLADAYMAEQMSVRSKEGAKPEAEEAAFGVKQFVRDGQKLSQTPTFVVVVQGGGVLVPFI